MATEEQEIISELARFSQAWNDGDAAAAAAFYTDDGTRVGAFGDRQDGREQITRAYEQLLHQSMPGAKVSQSHLGLRMLCPDHAISRDSLQITLPDGKEMKGEVIMILKKIDGSWLFLESHPKFYPARD